ncbi:MAG: DMT family transporter [Leptolyngbyaceae cyanobacterium RU_5_1]|nr:DMT family transporter [Leptolyngbyaceae cyanobacterium RU_5_1]
MRDRPSACQLTLVLTVGIAAVSTSAILVRLATAAAGAHGIGFSLVLSASRLLLAALMLLPAWRSVHRNQPTSAAWRYAGASGIALALHFVTWISSLSYTSIAASTTLVTTNPVWVALLSWLWFGEQPRQRTLVGISIALSGGILIGLSDTSSTSPGSQPLLGNGLALAGAWTFSLYFLMAREAQRQGLGVGSYSAISYSTAAIALLPLPLLTGASYVGYSPLVYGYILLTALLPQLIGHTSFNWAVRWVSPTLIALVILLEPVLSSLLGYIIFAEVPGLTVLIGALVLLTGVAIAVLA